MVKTGKVKFVNAERNYGFIIPDGGGEEVYFRLSAVSGGAKVRERDRVSFELGTDPQGRPRANSVSLVD